LQNLNGFAEINTSEIFYVYIILSYGSQNIVINGLILWVTLFIHTLGTWEL